jgi:hypothetical protein
LWKEALVAYFKRMFSAFAWKVPSKTMKNVKRGLNMKPMTPEYELGVLSRKLFTDKWFVENKNNCVHSTKFNFPIHSQSVMFCTERVINEKNDLD